MTKDQSKPFAGSNSKPVDLDLLRSVTAKDAKFEQELLEVFIDSGQISIDRMSAAVKTNDGNSWYMAAHAFKGAAASIGAFTLAKILERAQTHPKDDHKGKIPILADVKANFVLVVDFLKREIGK